MGKLPGWLIAVIIIAAIVAPSALQEFVSSLWSGLTTAFSGFTG